MNQVILPLYFGERPCDRQMMAILSEKDADYMLACMVRVWRDFAIARDDRRDVPTDPAARRKCAAVKVIEDFARWSGAAGDLVEAGIEAGFFTLVQVENGTSELILADFYPSNRPNAKSLGSSRLGGINKSVNRAQNEAQREADAQLEIFARSGALLEGVPKADVRAGVVLVNMVCGVLKLPRPQAQEWRESLVKKAIEVGKRYDAASIQRLMRWFVANREDPNIPKRMDFVFDRVDEFINQANREFA